MFPSFILDYMQYYNSSRRKEDHDQDKVSLGEMSNR